MLYRLAVRILALVFAILLVAYLIPGIQVDGFAAALIVAFILSVINVTLKPILFILTLPITLLTLGIFAFVLNALLLWFVASFVEGFEVTSFLAAFLGSIVISLVTSLLHQLLDSN